MNFLTGFEKISAEAPLSQPLFSRVRDAVKAVNTAKATNPKNKATPTFALTYGLNKVKKK